MLNKKALELLRSLMKPDDPASPNVPPSIVIVVTDQFTLQLPGTSAPMVPQPAE